MSDAKPAAPLVMLPGLICDDRMFRAQLNYFADAVGFSGYGESSTIVEMAHSVISAMPARVSLLGHSMGGRVALEVVRRAPERVARLALVSTGVHLVRDGEAVARQRLIDLGRKEGMEALVDAWLPPMVSPLRRADGELMRFMRTMLIEADDVLMYAGVTRGTKSGGFNTGAGQFYDVSAAGRGYARQAAEAGLALARR